ncbi:hypothetical protein Q3G72_010874 [Acer saccharum]|nr:hypothetical protein Q3G72_010874 [Acer saccharum]
MAGYSFETMSDSDAAAFGSGDYLFFITRGATANQVTVAPYSNGASGSLSGSGITLTYGGKSLTFSTNISTASTAGHIVFNDSSHLVVGTQAADATFTLTGSVSSTGTNVDPNTIYALGGNDTIDGTNAAALVSNYLNGGFGADTINGGAANNHIYGNSMTSQAGDVDPASGVRDVGDTITVTTGTNYINGNAGNDVITVGVNASGTGANAVAASRGSNRVFGGADNDTITVQGAGRNTVNGNSGNDVITDTGTGDNTLRGGQGDDIIRGGSGHSVLMGDVGNDVIFVHGRNGENVPTVGGTTTSTTAQQHINVITGGAGSDTFDFTGNNGTTSANNAGAGQAALFGQTVYYQEITDFTIGTDKIHLANNPSATGNVGHSTTIFATVQDAEVYANSQLMATGNQGNTPIVEALAVGSANNTFLFYLETGNTAVTTSEVAGLGIIHLDNVVAANVTYTDFNTSASVGTGTN